jgi:hypothetical protein
MRQAFRRLGLKCCCLFVVLCASGLGQGCSNLKAGTSAMIGDAILKEPTDRDKFFDFVAYAFNVRDLCSRIDGRANGLSGRWRADGGVRTLRSLCFDAVDGKFRGVVSPDVDEMPGFIAQIRALGYQDSDVVQRAYQGSNSLTSAYETAPHILGNDKLRALLRAGRGFEEPRDRSRLRPANAVEFLYQTVAIERREPALCSKISPNATFMPNEEMTSLLQSWCYVQNAQNMGSLAVCERLPASGSFPHILEHYDSRERCQETVRAYMKVPSSTTSSGPAAFRHVNDFPASLREIGFSDAELPAQVKPAHDEYWRFFFWHAKEAPAVIRAEFLGRVTALK